MSHVNPAVYSNIPWDELLHWDKQFTSNLAQNQIVGLQP